MNSYVYNEWDELEAILGPNNLATKFEYDAQGRLKRTYTEVIDSPGIPGGFQKQSENDYHYKLENQ
jgi:YD repeat-containing protein